VPRLEPPIFGGPSPHFFGLSSLPLNVLLTFLPFISFLSISAIMGLQPMEPDYALCGMNNWVGSFDPIKFIYFMLATVLIPYPVYIFVATVFNWEHRAKRPARHYQDVLNATSYGVIVFIFGNYAQTLK